MPVHPGREMSIHYFSCSGGHSVVSTKSVMGHVTLNLCVLYPVGSVGHILQFGASRARNIDALFFTLGRDHYRLHKKCAGTLYTKLMFLHPVGSCRSPSALWCIPGMKHRHTIFHARVGPVRI